MRIASTLMASTILVLMVGCDAGTKDSGPMQEVKGAASEVVFGSGDDAINPVFEERWNAFFKEPHDNGDTLVVGLPSDADSLLPLVSQTKTGSDAYGLIFLNLARTNPDFSEGMSLAKSWSFSKDRLELTFRLRDDVYWTDGEQTTADDVAWTFTKQTDPAIAWSSIKWKRFIKQVIALDKFTVKFVFEKVYPYQLMDAVVGPVLPKHLLEGVPSIEWKSCDFNRHPIGNGPFKLKEWKANEHIVLEANDKYYEGRPPLDRIIFKIVPEQQNLVMQLKSGEIDFMESVPVKFFAECARTKGITPWVYDSRAYTYLAWNLKNPLFQSRKVRQALTHAIDRESIVESLLKSGDTPLGAVCHGPITPIIWAHNPDVPRYDYNPELAKKMLAEEGWSDTDGDGTLDKNGLKFSFELKTNKGNITREDIVTVVQAQLRQIGIDARPSIIDANVLFSDLSKKDFDAAVAGWSVGLKMDMTTLWHTKSLNDKFNFCSYSNPEFDKINDEALEQRDRETSKPMWFEAQRIIAEDQPYTFLYIPKQINFVSSRFKNVQMETVGWGYNVSQWWVPKSEQKY